MHCVYKHTFPDGKVYIGQTIDGEAERRWANGYGYKGQPVFKAFVKFGWDNVDHEILENYIPDELIDEREWYWIEFYHANNPQFGYNSNSARPKTYKPLGWKTTWQFRRILEILYFYWLDNPDEEYVKVHMQFQKMDGQRQEKTIVWRNPNCKKVEPGPIVLKPLSEFEEKKSEWPEDLEEKHKNSPYRWG